MAFGLVPEGWNAKAYADVRASLVDWLRAKVSPRLDLSEEDPLGVVVSGACYEMADLWAASQALHSAFDISKATGSALEALAALTGTIRRLAKSSEALVWCAGLAGTTIPSGSRVRVGLDGQFVAWGAQFELGTAIVLSAVSAWAASTAYSVGDVRHISGQVFVCIVGGTSGLVGPTPNTNPQILLDGTCDWTWIGSSDNVTPGAALGTFTAVDSGAIAAPQYQAAEITTPVAGWVSARNPDAAALGYATQTDEELRVAQRNEVGGAGGGTLGAIRARMLELDGVTYCRVFYNNTNVVDGDGLPPKSIEVVVEGGATADIAEALLATVALGIGYHGSTTTTVEDSFGTLHTIRFTRTTTVDVWVTFDITIDEALFPADGADLIAAAVEEWGEDYPVARDVSSSAVSSRAYEVDGVLDLTPAGLAKIGTAAAPTLTATIAITPRQRALFSASRVVVNTTPGAP